MPSVEELYDNLDAFDRGELTGEELARKYGVPLESFRKGDRVEFTPEARTMFVGVAAGTVVGFSRNGLNIRVRHDGSKSAVSYAPHFWQRSNVPALPLGSRRCIQCDKFFDEAEVDRCLGCKRAPFCEHCLIEHACGG